MGPQCTTDKPRARRVDATPGGSGTKWALMSKVSAPGTRGSMLLGVPDSNRSTVDPSGEAARHPEQGRARVSPHHPAAEHPPARRCRTARASRARRKRASRRRVPSRKRGSGLTATISTPGRLWRRSSMWRAAVRGCRATAPPIAICLPYEVTARSSRPSPSKSARRLRPISAAEHHGASQRPVAVVEEHRKRVEVDPDRNVESPVAVEIRHPEIDRQRLQGHHRAGRQSCRPRCRRTDRGTMAGPVLDRGKADGRQVRVSIAVQIADLEAAWMPGKLAAVASWAEAARCRAIRDASGWRRGSRPLPSRSSRPSPSRSASAMSPSWEPNPTEPIGVSPPEASPA